MSDMLVKLYSLPEFKFEGMTDMGITIRRPLPSEKSLVIDWVLKKFSSGWADECEITFSYHPISTFIAVVEERITGFASYDAACRNFFGPTGVARNFRGKGIGKALLLRSLYAMKEQGYAYGIIGGVGPADFYSKTVGAVRIDNSEQGIYKTRLQGKPTPI